MVHRFLRKHGNEKRGEPMAWLLKLVYQNWSVPYFEFDDEEKYGDPVAKAFGFSRGFWFDPANMPVSGHQTTTKRVPDVFPMPGCNAVSQRFKDLVEEFEPGVHQFMPLKLRFENGEPLPQMYYVFNCMVAVDAVLVEPSGLLWHTDVASRQPAISIDGYAPIFLSTKITKSIHLWTGLYLDPVGHGVFCSDAFQKQLKKRKIRFLEQTYCEELDVPWRAEENIQPALDWEAEHEKLWGYRPKLRAQTLKLRGKLGL